MYAVSEQGRRDGVWYLIFRSGDTHEEKQVSQGNADTQVYQDQILVILNIPVDKNDRLLIQALTGNICWIQIRFVFFDVD